ncbi:hypothetical protein ACQP1W_40045 [Spirillospora sp. CA-255316]
MREAVRGNGPVDKTGTAPQADFTTHIGPTMHGFVDAHDWLTVFRFPVNAPELNPAGGVWPNLESRLRNLAVRGVDQLTLVVKSHLKRMQYRPGLLDVIITGTGLNLAQPP